MDQERLTLTSLYEPVLGRTKPEPRGHQMHMRLLCLLFCLQLCVLLIIS